MFELQPSTSKASTSQVPVPQLNELDSALHELGMLSTLTESRRDYLQELSAKRPVLNLVEMNTRFVRSVSIGLRMKPVTTHIHRMKPYAIPSRQRGEERHRTRSENADIIEATGTSLVASVIDAVVSVATDEVQNMKKSKSLENVHLETEKPAVPEVELVSTCIQKLKMAE